SGPRPALLLQHGASTKKDDLYIQQPSRRWSQAGYVCMAIDAPGHGERAVEPPLSRQELWRRGLLFRMRDQRIQGVVDLMRALDYLESRPEVDTRRIGYMGVSMGTFLGVPLCGMDQRVRSAVFIVGGGNLRGLLGRSSLIDPQEAELVFQVTDPVCFAPRIAPRPVLMLNGERDDVIPRASTEALFEALRDPKVIRWFDMAHTVTGEVYKEPCSSSTKRSPARGAPRPHRICLLCPSLQAGVALVAAETQPCPRARPGLVGEGLRPSRRPSWPLVAAGASALPEGAATPRSLVGEGLRPS
ncbi:MAG: dienelactone hydrolase family protein, partial [Dehalococcoidia bacterium]|nr:dienelactone hydrolase family protein [Dehalococcoidia bacterium]